MPINNTAFRSQLKFETSILIELFTCNVGVHVFGNSSPSHPWKKVQAAKSMFEDVVSRDPNTSEKEELISDIFRVLRNDTL